MGSVGLQVVVFTQCLAQMVVAPVSSASQGPASPSEVSLPSPPPPDSSGALEAPVEPPNDPFGPAQTPGTAPAPGPDTAAPVRAPAVTTPAPQPVVRPAPAAAPPPPPPPAATCPTCLEIPVWNAPPPTRTGDALIVAGSGFLTVGIPTTIVGLGFSFDIPFFALVWMVPSIAFTGAGAGMLVGGLRRRKRFRQWMVDHHAHPPANGIGLMTGGGLLLGTSIIPLGFTIASSSLGGGVESVTLVTFLGSALTGGLMLGYGIKRRRAYLRWRPNHAFTRNMQVAPLTLRRGAGLMVHTRF